MTDRKQDPSEERSALILIGILAAIAAAYFIFPGPQIRENAERIEAERIEAEQRATEEERAAKERRKMEFDADQAAFKSADDETLGALVRECQQRIVDGVARGSSFSVSVQNYSPRDLRKLADASGIASNGTLVVPPSVALDNHSIDIEKFNIDNFRKEGIVNPIIQMAIEHAEDGTLRRYAAIYFCPIAGMKVEDPYRSHKYYFRG